jgi:hypothetical protein
LVDVVAEEEVLARWYLSANFEHAQQVEEVAVEVSDDADGGFYFDEVGLMEENMRCEKVKDGLDSRLGHVHVSQGFTFPHSLSHAFHLPV